MIGQVVKAVVSQRTIQEGTRKGEVANQIDRLKRADDDVLASVGAEQKANAEMDEIF